MTCCGGFDYRDIIFDAWDEFTSKCSDLFDRFMGYRVIGCCAPPEEGLDGPAQRIAAKKTFDTYHEVHQTVVSLPFFPVFLVLFFF